MQETKAFRARVVADVKVKMGGYVRDQGSQGYNG